MLAGKHILLVIAGGIAAYKALELIRRLREDRAEVRCVLTRGGAQFVTPLSVQTLSENPVHEDLFSLTEESEMGHLALAQAADLIVVAPATADLIARIAHGQADDLAATLLLASDRPLLVAPAMNTRMWRHPATQANVATLEARGAMRIGPEDGPLAEGEVGPGRMAEPADIRARIRAFFEAEAPLAGRRALVTSGPTWEAIDPVRYIANRSSGKQGHAIAAALARLGAETALIAGPTHEPDPPGVTLVRVESAAQMLEAALAALPADIAVCAAAVADWRVADAPSQKIKKRAGDGPPTLALAENPDILARLADAGKKRPALVIGFAAETEDLVANARAKRLRKGCDWILANDVAPGTDTFGGARNRVHLVSEEGVEDWPEMNKTEVADKLARCIARHFEAGS